MLPRDDGSGFLRDHPVEQHGRDAGIDTAERTDNSTAAAFCGAGHDLSCSGHRICMSDPITDPSDAPSDDNLIDGRPGDTVPDGRDTTLTTDDTAQDDDSEVRSENS